VAVLNYNPGLADSDGSTFVVFPLPITKWDPERTMLGTSHEIPAATGAKRTGHRKGPFRFRIEGIIRGDDAEACIDLLDALETKAESADDLWLIRYRTAGGTNQEYWKDVHCETFGHARSDRPMLTLRWWATFEAKDATKYESDPLGD